jgi:SAM-dependent methyltransferase
MTATTDAYFDEQWTGSDDPWDQADRFYETRKYDLTAAMPRRRRYRRAFEPGCATGLLTERLLRRCDEVVATDRHPHAVEVTRRRVGQAAGASISVGRIPDDWPDGSFDLIVLSEVLYYLDLATLRRCLDAVMDSLETGGELIVVHYRVPVREHALLGDVVHRNVEARSGLQRFGRHVEEQFMLDGYQRW